MSREEVEAAGSRIDRCSVRYIKLGSGGRWEAAAIDGRTLEWGSEADPIDFARQRDWAGARRHYIDRGVPPGTATSYVRELTDFFTLGSDALWITFARDRLWWAFADPDVEHRGSATTANGAFFRRTIGPWRSTDLRGKPLIQSELSSALTKVAGYRQTMCKVEAQDYLFRLLNAEDDMVQAKARADLAQLHASFVPLIQGLHWSDFELLVDLIFSRAGWQRVSRLGGTLKDHDLILEQPITRDRISVQVKSRADQAVLNRYAAIFAANDYSRFFFITHNDMSLTSPQPDRITAWSVQDVAQQTVAAGLSDWLLDRAA
jgi:hypothetical protein